MTARPRGKNSWCTTLLPAKKTASETFGPNLICLSAFFGHDCFHWSDWSYQLWPFWTNLNRCCRHLTEPGWFSCDGSATVLRQFFWSESTNIRIHFAATISKTSNWCRESNFCNIDSWIFLNSFLQYFAFLINSGLVRAFRTCILIYSAFRVEQIPIQLR